MAERFFVAQIEGDVPLRLTGEEAHHLVHVCRIGRGGQVRLFDGSGAEWTATVEQIGKRDVLLSVSGRELVDRELPFGLTLACSPPKGDRLRWLVEKATELGVTRFVPLQTERTSVRVRGVTADKLRRWVIEASKQCGRNVLMQVSEPVPWLAFVDSVDSSMIRILAHAAAQDDLDASELLNRDVAIAVGPEGGFTDAEVGQARDKGWVVTDLGPRTLRIETAALAVVARLTVNFPPAALSSRIPSPSR